MRGLDTPAVGVEAFPDVSPGGAAFATGFLTSVGPQMASIVDMLNTTENKNIKNHVELNAIFPDASEKFTESMPLDRARFIYERQLVKRQYEQNMQYGSGTDRFIGSALGGLADPVGNTLGILGGPAIKAAGIVGTSMAGRIGVSMAENFIGNMAADVASYKTSKELHDEYDFTDRIAANLAGSALFGTAGGLLHHYFRESPNLGKTLEEAAHNRGVTGLDPEGVKPIYDAHIAAENSGTHYPYEHAPFDQKAKFYSGSKHYTEDFNSAELAMRDSSLATERGAQMFSNENIAHAGALTEGSGPTGSVFEHNLADKNIVNGNLPISEVGTLETIQALKIAMERYGPYGKDVAKFTPDMPLASAYREVLKAHYAGVLSAEEVQMFEKSLNGAEGMHFEMKDFRGQPQEPSHGVYMFDKNNIEPVGVKNVNPDAVGKMSKERLMSIKTSVNGEDRVFNYEKKFNKKYGQEMWVEIKDKALKNTDQLAFPVDQAETKIDQSFTEAKQRITEADQFEGHVDAATKRALESATEDFKHANNLSKIYSTIKACLR